MEIQMLVEKPQRIRYCRVPRVPKRHPAGTLHGAARPHNCRARPGSPPRRARPCRPLPLPGLVLAPVGAAAGPGARRAPASASGHRPHPQPGGSPLEPPQHCGTTLRACARALPDALDAHGTCARARSPPGMLGLANPSCRAFRGNDPNTSAGSARSAAAAGADCFPSAAWDERHDCTRRRARPAQAGPPASVRTCRAGGRRRGRAHRSAPAPRAAGPFAACSNRTQH